MALHWIKPGITELAQISGCRGETETIDKMQKRVEMDLAYINNWSIWLDLKILIKPPFTRRMTRGYRASHDIQMRSGKIVDGRSVFF